MTVAYCIPRLHHVRFPLSLKMGSPWLPQVFLAACDSSRACARRARSSSWGPIARRSCMLHSASSSSSSRRAGGALLTANASLHSRCTHAHTREPQQQQQPRACPSCTYTPLPVSLPRSTSAVRTFSSCPRGWLAPNGATQSDVPRTVGQTPAVVLGCRGDRHDGMPSCFFLFLFFRATQRDVATRAKGTGLTTFHRERTIVTLRLSQLQ